VAGKAGKPAIKHAVEAMFQVQVDSVRVCNVKGKRKSFKQIRGRRPGWKKAYVRLKPGFDIDFMGTQ
jgi:Ribosomal protein L23